METLERDQEVEASTGEALVLRSAGDGRLRVVTSVGPVAVRLRQCFPWSEPQRHLSLRDDEEQEVALVHDPATLDDESRQALEQAMAEAGFVLEVTRVLEIEEEIEIRQWTVETAQGPRSFQTHLDEWPRVLPMGGLLIRDVAGDLYRLAAPAKLDRKSRELLWAFVD
ncbi:MAG TPA: DUF1854 domain-containing protein [Gemmatimonadaceae bacterium]|nr:DUF1854 domain-containing protein [Gemmatimonadaceae bacterium]